MLSRDARYGLATAKETMKQFQANSEQMIANVVQFLRTTFARNHKKNGIIAVSGGIDSAISLTLLVKALGREHVHAVLLPYDDQDMTDAQGIVEWNKLPAENVQIINIKPVVAGVLSALQQAVSQKPTTKPGESASTHVAASADPDD